MKYIWYLSLKSKYPLYAFPYESNAAKMKNDSFIFRLFQSVSRKQMIVQCYRTNLNLNCSELIFENRLEVQMIRK